MLCCRMHSLNLFMYMCVCVCVYIFPQGLQYELMLAPSLTLNLSHMTIT